MLTKSGSLVLPETWSEELKSSVGCTQRFLRNSFRLVLASDLNADIAEQVLNIEDPHVFASWTSMSALAIGDMQVVTKLQFDSEDGRQLRCLRACHNSESELEGIVLDEMKQSMNSIVARLQNCCHEAGLTTGMSQASMTRAFEQHKSDLPNTKGALTDQWLLRVDECAIYCVTYLLFDTADPMIRLGRVCC